jgi:ribosome-associated toxin RatA of RatAB toxin-antitoxin module
MDVKDRRRRRPLGIASAVKAFVAALTVAAAQAGALSADEARRIEAGEVIVTSIAVPGHSLPRTKVDALIQAPPQAVWAIVQDCANYSRTMPRVLVSEELERNGERVHCRSTIDMPFPFGDLVADTDGLHTAFPDGSYKREWKHRSGDFKTNEGSWTVRPHAAGAATFVTYDALMEPNVPLPNWILEWAQTSELPSMIEGLRKQVTTR